MEGCLRGALCAHHLAGSSKQPGTCPWGSPRWEGEVVPVLSGSHLAAGSCSLHGCHTPPSLQGEEAPPSAQGDREDGPGGEQPGEA